MNDMNLHLLHDEKFFDPFAEKLESLGLLDNNVFVIKECGPLKFIRRTDLVFGRLCDTELLGDVSRYKKVFIHSFSFEMYRWVHQHTFQELNWMIWGKELYESELVDFKLYEPHTKRIVRKIRNTRITLALYYRRAENYLMNIDVKKIYNKIDNVLTWIEPEYNYAVKHIKGLNAKHKEFAYTFEHDVKMFIDKFNTEQFYINAASKNLRFIIGNSGASANNHLDALHAIAKINFGEVMMPVSYGDQKYILLLKQEVLSTYGAKHITYADKFLNFGQYLDFFNRYDVFVSNSLRPIGMGNIWMAFLLGKLVFMNPNNLVFSYLKSLGLNVYGLDTINQIATIVKDVDLEMNKKIASNFLATERIDELYAGLFGKSVEALELC